MKFDKGFVFLFLLVFFAGSGVLAMGSAAPDKSEKKADYVITDIKVDRSHLAKDKKVTVTYTVKNQGKAAGSKSYAKIEAVHPEAKQIKSHPIPELDPGESHTGKVDYTILKTGKYVFKATADYKKNIVEGNELNNENSVRFSFGRVF